MREKRWLLLALFGILSINAVTDGMKATRPKFKIATTSTTTTTEESRIEDNENDDGNLTTPSTNSSEGNSTTGHTLTGIPQIDYIWDPNLPRELNGYNLSDYPFYNSIPEDIDFKCDGLHDGFYASVPHKCQVYHHCLFGTRYDFLCANFTAFDQKTFICHFVSEVDCANSKKYWHRNDALYKATTSSTTSTSTTTTTTVSPVTMGSSSNGRGSSSSRERDLRRRRPYSRRRPYEYYDEDYYDDEYTRPRGYDRRDDYEYEDRKYRRDRDRGDIRDRDRDFRDRDTTRSRETNIREDRDREVLIRERYPSRNNRRDQTRQRDPPDDEIRGLKTREQEQSRSREIEDPELDDRRIDLTRTRDNDNDRRYSDKRFRDDYDDKELLVGGSGVLSNQGSIGVTEGLVKPAAPITSVYSRPRAPPKIRRPVPLSEQDRYSYKSTSAQSTEEPRRRPTDVEDDYYDDELEDVRPMRRPIRRRPSYRERDRDRDFYDVRDRERDRPFRTRYRDDEDDIRPRKHPDRSRDRYYERERERDRSLERGRDRSVDRGKDLSAPRSLDRDRGRYQEADRIERPYSSNRPLDKEKDNNNRPTIEERSRSSFRSKDLSDTTETSKRPISTTSTTCMPEMPPIVHDLKPETKQTSLERFERPERPTRPIQSYNNNNNNNGARVSLEEKEDNLGEKSIKPVHYTTYQEKDQEEEEEQDHRYPQQQQQQQQHHTSSYSEEYSSEYYDEPEDPPIPPPRTTVRIVKRPFLPSRGGVPNPRGLSPVGSKAPRREEDRSTERTSLLQQHEENHKGYYVPEQESKRIVQDDKREEEKQTYDAYKVIQSDLQQKQRQEEYDITIARPILRRPIERQREDKETKSLELNPISKISSTESYEDIRKTLDSGVPGNNNKWSTEQLINNKENNDGTVSTSSSVSSVRGKNRQPVTEISNLYSSTYREEDIHEQPSGPSNYRVKQRINEVTHKLQDIPDSEYDVTLNDALTPTLNQETNLPSGFVLPLHRQLNRDTILQPSEDNYKISRPINQQQQKPFVPSPQFDPAPVVSNDRQRTVYYRTPESIPYSGQHYRQQSGTWQDYTGY